MIATMSAPTESAYPPQGGYGPPTGDVAVIRSVGRCILLLVFSFGLWGFAWMYHTAKEVSSRVRQPPPSPGVRAALFVIPIVNYVMLFFSWQEIEDYCRRTRSQDFPLVLFFVLTLLIPFAALFTMPIVQSRMNDAHRAATNGAATNAPMETIDWVFLILGILFFLLYILIIIVVIAAAATS